MCTATPRKILYLKNVKFNRFQKIKKERKGRRKSKCNVTVAVRKSADKPGLRLGSKSAEVLEDQMSSTEQEVKVQGWGQVLQSESG
jgi:hypothetical protein